MPKSQIAPVCQFTNTAEVLIVLALVDLMLA